MVCRVSRVVQFPLDGRSSPDLPRADAAERQARPAFRFPFPCRPGA